MGAERVPGSGWLGRLEDERTARLDLAIPAPPGRQDKAIGEGFCDFVARRTYVRQFGLHWSDVQGATADTRGWDRLTLTLLWPLLVLVVRGGEVVYQDGHEFTRRRAGRRWYRFERADLLWPLYSLGEATTVAPADGAEGSDGVWRVAVPAPPNVSGESPRQTSVEVQVDESGRVTQLTYDREIPPMPSARLRMRLGELGTKVSWPSLA